MNAHPLVRTLFWLLAATVLFLALVPGPLGSIIASDVERHYFAFLLLPAIAAYAWPRIPVPMMWLAFVVFGGLIEILQMQMGLGRAGEWRDWMNDMTATTISLVVSAVVLRTIRADRIA